MPHTRFTVCPDCGGPLEELALATTRAGRSRENPLPPDAQAVAERAVGKLGVGRREAQDVIRRITQPSPKGLGRDVREVRGLVDETARRLREGSVERPLGYLLDLARRRREPPPAAPEGNELARAWEPYRGGRPVPIVQLLESTHVDGHGEDAPDEEPCPDCAGARFIRTGWEIRGGVYTPIVEACPRCGVETEAERTTRLLRQSGLLGMAEMRLGDFRPVEGAGEALQAAREFGAGALPQLVLAGPPGSGKTHLAVGALLECIGRGEAARYQNVALFLEELRMAYGDDAETSFGELFGAAAAVPTLALDDLGAERGTPWAREKMYEIVDARYSAGLRTLACSNHEPGDWDARVRSRLCDKARGRVVVLAAGDYRLD